MWNKLIVLVLRTFRVAHLQRPYQIQQRLTRRIHVSNI